MILVRRGKSAVALRLIQLVHKKFKCKTAQKKQNTPITTKFNPLLPALQNNPSSNKHRWFLTEIKLVKHCLKPVRKLEFSLSESKQINFTKTECSV